MGALKDVYEVVFDLAIKANLPTEIALGLTVYLAAEGRLGSVGAPGPGLLGRLLHRLLRGFGGRLLRGLGERFLPAAARGRRLNSSRGGPRQ